MEDTAESEANASVAWHEKAEERLTESTVRTKTLSNEGSVDEERLDITTSSSNASEPSADALSFDQHGKSNSELSNSRRASSGKRNDGALHAPAVDHDAVANKIDAVDGSVPIKSEKLLSVSTNAEKQAVVENIDSNPTQSVNSGEPQFAKECEKCATQAVETGKLQSTVTQLQLEFKMLQKSAERYQADLSREKAFRDEMETTLTQAVEESQFRASNLYSLVREMESSTTRLVGENQRLKESVTSSLKICTPEKEHQLRRISSLEEEKAQLMDLHSAYAQDIDNEDINLPNTVEELHMLVLKQRDDLIKNKVAREHIEQSQQHESATHRQYLKQEKKARNELESNYKRSVHELRARCDELDAERLRLEKLSQRVAPLEKDLSDTRNELVAERSKLVFVTGEQSKRINDLSHANERYEGQLKEKAARIKTLHESLENSEHVQMDFVRMNQELQMALERIRQEATEVRWQFEEDVHECHQCREPFTLPGATPAAAQRRSGPVGFLAGVASGATGGGATAPRQRSPKIHCRHCGKIFCENCLTKEVQAGPAKRLVKVCDLCHTLLSKHQKPYFSEKIDKQQQQKQHVQHASTAANKSAANSPSPFHVPNAAAAAISAPTDAVSAAGVATKPVDAAHAVVANNNDPTNAS